MVVFFRALLLACAVASTAAMRVNVRDGISGVLAGSNIHPALPSFSATVTEHPQTLAQTGEYRSVPHFTGGSVKYDAVTASSFMELFFTGFAWVAPRFERLFFKQLCTPDGCRALDRSGVVASKGAPSPYLDTLYKLLARISEAKYKGADRVLDQPCHLWELRDPAMGNLSACIGNDGVPRSYVAEPAGDAVGWSNIGEWAHNMTFSDIRIGDVSGFEPMPLWFEHLEPGIQKPCAVPTATGSIQVLRAFGDPEPMGVLEDRDTFDWLGQGVTLGTPTSLRFASKQYLELFDVEVDGKYGIFRDCNYNRALGRNACTGPSGWPANAVTRSSAEVLTGEFAMGMCDENEVVGSWYTFPHEGKCGDDAAVGDGDCTWKVNGVKVVAMECVGTFNSSGWARAWESDYERAPFPNVLAQLKAAVGACPDVRSNKSSEERREEFKVGEEVECYSKGQGEKWFTCMITGACDDAVCEVKFVGGQEGKLSKTKIRHKNRRRTRRRRKQEADAKKAEEAERLKQEADAKKEPLSHKNVSRTATAHMHIIGDSHGDLNFLVRSLISTGRFELDSKHRLSWRQDLDDDEDWEVVILGDLIDRGAKEKECLLNMRRLSEHAKWGDRLVVLMGNHESMLLRHSEKYAQDEAWSADARREALTATEGEDFELVEWMIARPVLHLSKGVLLMHGGLSEKITKKLIRDKRSGLNAICHGEGTGAACGAAMAQFVNSEATKYYNETHSCIRDAPSREKAKLCQATVRTSGAEGRPYFLESTKRGSPESGGVLWYRGYSQSRGGAGTVENCNKAAWVGERVGARVFAVAHTTHEFITEFCKSKVPIYVTDVHRSDCMEAGECDFDVSTTFHKESIKPNKKNVPQSLKLEIKTPLRKPDQRTYKAETCLSKVWGADEPDGAARVNVLCFPPKLS